MAIKKVRLLLSFKMDGSLSMDGPFPTAQPSSPHNHMRAQLLHSFSRPQHNGRLLLSLHQPLRHSLYRDSGIGNLSIDLAPLMLKM